MSSVDTRRTSGKAADLGAATRVRWAQIAPTLFVVWLVSTIDKANMSIVQNNVDFLHQFRLTGQQARVGLLSTGLLVGYGVAAPLWGWVVGRIGARRTAALSLVGWGLISFWSGLASSYNSLLGSRIALGLCESSLYPLTLVLVAHWFALKERGRATAFWWIANQVAPMIVGLMVTFLIVNFGWRVQFYAVGALALVLPLPMIWFFVRDRPAEHPAVNSAEASLVEAGSLENNQEAPGRLVRAEKRPWYINIRYWLVAISISVNSIMYWGWLIWLPTYLRTVRGFSFSGSGYLTFVIYGFSVATILTFGHFSDRIFRRAPLAGVGWILSAVFLMATALAPSPAWAIVLLVCTLCSQEIGVSCAEMLMHSVVVGNEMGPSQGVRAMLTQFMGGLSPLMIGVIVQMTGSFLGVFLVLSAAMAVSAGCMIKLALEGY